MPGFFPAFAFQISGKRLRALIRIRARLRCCGLVNFRFTNQGGFVDGVDAPTYRHRNVPL